MKKALVSIVLIGLSACGGGSGDGDGFDTGNPNDFVGQFRYEGFLNVDSCGIALNSSNREIYNIYKSNEVPDGFRTCNSSWCLAVSGSQGGLFSGETEDGILGVATGGESQGCNIFESVTVFYVGERDFFDVENRLRVACGSMDCSIEYLGTMTRL